MKKFIRGLIIGSLLGSFLTIMSVLRSPFFKNALYDAITEKTRTYLYGPNPRTPQNPYQVQYQTPISRRITRSRAQGRI